MSNSHSVLWFFFLASITHAVHFRGGYISWQTVSPSLTNATTITIKVQQTYSWAYSTYPCVSPIGNAYHLACITSNCSNYASSMISTQTPCISYDLGLSVSTGQSTTSVTLLAGAKLVLAFQNSNWLTLVSGGASAWSLTTNIDLTVRSDNGRINSSPTSSMTALFTVLISTQQTVRIPLADVDSDIVKCRWANQTAVIDSTVIDECGGACQDLFGAQLYSSSNTDNNCTVVFTTTLAGYYVLAVQIEDYMPSAPNGLPLSSIPLQFLVLSLNVSCNAPTIIGQLADGTAVHLEANQTFSVSIIAQAGCNTTLINRFSTIALPSGTALTSTVISLGSMLYSIVFTYTSTYSEVGSTQIYCTMATDGNNLQSAQYCLNFVIIAITTTTSTSTTSSTSTTTSTETTANTSTLVYNTTMYISVSTVVTSATSATNNLSLQLGLGLGLGLPLLLLLSALATCALCRWYPGRFWKELRQRFWQDKDGLCQLCRSRHGYRSSIDDVSKVPGNSSQGYRQQYINEEPVASNEQSFSDYSFTPNSLTSSGLGSITTIRTPLVPWTSNKVVPSVNVRIPMMRSVPQSPWNPSDSILVKAFAEQKAGGDKAFMH